MKGAEEMIYKLKALFVARHHIENMLEPAKKQVAKASFDLEMERVGQNRSYKLDGLTSCYNRQKDALDNVLGMLEATERMIEDTHNEHMEKGQTK